MAAIPPTGVANLPSTLELLCAPKKLDRERGEDHLNNMSLTHDEVKFVSSWIEEKLEGLSNWEDVFGGIVAAIILLRNVDYQLLVNIGIVSKLEDKAIECHENFEFRVRIAAGQLMGSLCHHAGLSLFLRYLPAVIQGVTTNLERNTEAPVSETELSLRELDLAKDRSTNSSRSSLSIFHDTAGWKNLETWMKCLQEMVSNISADDFIKVDRSVILELIFKAVQHINRFVRETGYDVLSTMISRHICYTGPDSKDATYINVAIQLAKGLSDNWSQVRMAASRAVRTVFEVDPPPGYTRDNIYPILLPAMCLNRYYVAEGVRIYSQDTWCRVTQGEGRKLLSQNLIPAVDYYIEQSDADNHAVREASCAAIAEIVTKLDSNLLLPCVNKLLDALTICFGDESWPVRDAACVALGSLISIFPNETRAAGYDDLMAPQFLRNLSDSIPSVRDGAAKSIAAILKAVDDQTLFKHYISHIAEKIDGLSKQPNESHGAESSRISGKGPGASHVTVHSGDAAHDNRHTDQVMYSCGSLAPKLQKGMLSIHHYFT
ncbi:Armadillo type fold [Schistosoma japonicum]|nr:Armadillo type fold [Schistosoma japonicum]